MKVKNKYFTLIILILAIALASYLAGYYVSKYRYSIPRNCAEIAASYLEMGKKYYGLDSNKYDEWNKAIEKETYIQEYCLEQFPLQYPWDY